MAPHWEYFRWLVYLCAAAGTWRYLPLTIVRLIAAFTRSERRNKQCMEVLRLARRDAARIPSYLTTSEPSHTRAAATDSLTPISEDHPLKRIKDMRGSRSSSEAIASPTPSNTGTA